MSSISHPLDFERPIVELEMELERLKDAIATGDRTKMAEFEKIESKLGKLRKDVYGNLTS